jgi:hypothetical protein
LSERVFDYAPAARARVPLITSLAGPSGGGKTFSALRLATGMQRVSGGDIAYIDTESRRALHYAEKFRFHHVPFGAPFSPLDYLQAIEHCVKKGARVLAIDSLSHEHEGPGGVLEWHAKEVERLSTAWGVKGDKANIPAWAVPKAARRQFINSLLQLDINLIMCFRAKEKIAIKGSKVIDMGWMPIAGEEFIYEASMQCLLLPGSDGVPTWNPERPGEKAMAKLPDQFRGLMADPKPLSEDIGQQLAEWAAGAPVATASDEDLAQVLDSIAGCSTVDGIRAVAEKHRNAKPWSGSQKAKIKAAIDLRTGELDPK